MGWQHIISFYSISITYDYEANKFRSRANKTHVFLKIHIKITYYVMKIYRIKFFL
jgi:hypothetical protein